MLVPLCRYVYSAYKANKCGRPWQLLPAAIASGTLLGSFFLLAISYLPPIPELPFLEMLKDSFGTAYVAILGCVFCCAIMPYEIIKLFWLFFLSPVYRECGQDPAKKAANLLEFFIYTILAALLVPMLYFTILLLITAFINTLSVLSAPMLI